MKKAWLELSAKQRFALIRIFVSVVIAVASVILKRLPLAHFILSFAAYAVAGYDVVLKAVKGILRLRLLDEKFLMTAASLGAFALGEYLEGASVMILYQIGELFESVAVGKSRRSISQIMDIRPDYANVIKENGETVKTEPDELRAGALIAVMPGEKVPIDGVVEEGRSSVDTSALTGESMPASVSEGDEILSGTINLTGLLKIRTTKEFGESTASKILELVENAGSRKSRSEEFISKFAAVYTPVVCLSALLLAVMPPVLRLAAGVLPQWGEWIYRSLSFLVISCPCALVISVPLTFFAALGGAGKAGILIKGSNYMEPLAKADIVVLDKTGTVTQGAFKVSGVHHSNIENGKLIEAAALAECCSNHPISLSLRKAYGAEADRSRVDAFEEISGEGVVAVVDGRKVACGNEKLMHRVGSEAVGCKEMGTVVHVAVDGEYAGHILISDAVKPGAQAAVAGLKDIGVRKTVMLTGDSEKIAAHVADSIGIDDFYADLLPANKVRIVETLLEEKQRKGSLIFAGDGLNDAPVLARADVGIAMGGIGSDAAVEAADVVIMDDDPLKIPKGIRIAKKSMRIVYENIAFALGVKVVCLVLGATGITGMWAAVFADTGVMMIAVINAIRALDVKNV